MKELDGLAKECCSIWLLANPGVEIKREANANRAIGEGLLAGDAELRILSRHRLTADMWCYGGMVSSDGLGPPAGKQDHIHPTAGRARRSGIHRRVHR